jgi:hypothetical protein
MTLIKEIVSKTRMSLEVDFAAELKQVQTVFATSLAVTSFITDL